MELLYVFFSSVVMSFLMFVMPLTISCLFIIFWMRNITKDDPVVSSMHGKKEFITYIFTLHTNKGLLSQGGFWLSIITPFVYFIVLGMMIWKDYTIRLDAEGFRTFISISALPLGILSLSIPLSAIVGRFHASKQTARQIDVVSQKNNIDLYHSHRKELFSYFEQIGEVKFNDNLTARNKVHPRLHKIYFKGNPKDGTPQVVVEKLKEVGDRLSTARHFLSAVLLDINPNASLAFYIEIFCRDMMIVSYNLGLQEIIEMAASSPRYPCEINGDKLNLETVGRTTDDAISALKCAENFFHNLCDFASYESDYFSKEADKNELRNAIKNKFKPFVIERLHKEIIIPAMIEAERKQN